MIKRYTPDPDAIKNVEHLLGPHASCGEVLNNAISVAAEYRRLEAHHEKETKFLIRRIEELELLATL